MSKWIELGVRWDTETICTIRELLKENRIPFRMTFDDMFFQSVFHLPRGDRRWNLNVRRRDLARVLALLEEEGLFSLD